MATEIIKYAFVAGEISPTLYGRTDLTKYDLALSKGRNWIVDYRGGLFTRPGYEFCDFLPQDDKNIKTHSFNFSPDTSNAYLIIFGHEFIRFVQDNAYVLNETGPINAWSSVLTSVGHGLTVGRWVKIINAEGAFIRSFVVTEVPDTDTFTLATLPDGTPYTNTENVGGWTWAAVYEVPSPYTTNDVLDLRVEEYNDLLRITHHLHPIRNLVRHDHADWVLGDEVISPGVPGPYINNSSASGTGNAQVVFAISSVDANGLESLVGQAYDASNIVNYTTEEGSVKVSWNAVTSAVEYNVYRSVVASGNTLTSGTDLGYVGRTKSTEFVDPNIIPDFTHTPSVRNDPFTPGAIDRIDIITGGAGYSPFSNEITIVDPTGSGFVGEAIADSAGHIVNVVIKDPGRNYSSPEVVFGTGGATAVAYLRLGNNPRISRIYQQRQIYGGSDNSPDTIWGSRYKRFSNFNVSSILSDSDSVEFNLDSNAISPIREMLVTRGGLLTFTQESVWLVSGGANGQALTPTQALADPQTYTGISKLNALHIGSDVLYFEGKGYTVRLLTYNEVSKVYGGEDKSILASHLFGPGKEIISWCYQESPFKVVWAIREDGIMLCFTIVQTENVFAWTTATTRGKFLDCTTVRENTTERVYVVTHRYVNGRYTKMLERMQLHEFKNVEDAWCVDAGLSLGVNCPQASIIITLDSDERYSITADADIFGQIHVGQVIRAGNGVFLVKQVLNSRKVICKGLAECDLFVPESEITYTFPIPPGKWTLDKKVFSLSGLWHLEGETVSILGDGNVFPTQKVVNGQITLTSGVTRAIVGLGYQANAVTLPLISGQDTIEGRRKRTVGVAVRLNDSRGVLVGGHEDDLYPIPERTNEDWGQPTRLINGVKYQMVSSLWDEDARVFLRVDDPLPAYVLALVMDTEIGDDSD